MPLTPRSLPIMDCCGRRRTCGGFTLVELAIVLFIVALLLGTLLVPMGAQIDQRNNAETMRVMGEAREALIGYAASHIATDGKPYLPCPDNSNSGAEDTRSPMTGGCPQPEGNLPWAALGLAQTDVWNNRIRYRVTAAFSNWKNGFQLTTSGGLQVCNEAACTIVIANNIPAVIVSHGKNGAGATRADGSVVPAPTGADEQQNTNGNTDFVSHAGTTDFDDLVVWVPTSLLFNRMVAAGRLP